MKTSRFLFFIFSTLITWQVSAQNLNPGEKRRVTDSLCLLLKSRYVFTEKGAKLAAFISTREQSGAYDAISDPKSFGDTLTQELLNQSKDQHFVINFDPAWVADTRASVSPADSLALRKKRAEQYRAINYGYREIRNLDGNIGYLRITRFVDPIAAGPAVVAAMTSLSSSDALIIDIRDNGGGFKESVDLIASYLFDANKDFTLPYVPGKRLTDLPVYLLINRFTYSAAEGFSQLLKGTHRAVLVGENTGGAAHGIARLVITSRFYINMPVSRPNPDWEGSGIAPDIRVDPAAALDTAVVCALKDLSNSHPDNRNEYQWLLEDGRAKAMHITYTAKALKIYTGDYGPRQIFAKDGRLWYHRAPDPPYVLEPMGSTLFRFADTDDLRIRFVVHNGQASQLQIIYKEGGFKTIDKTGLLKN